MGRCDESRAQHLLIFPLIWSAYVDVTSSAVVSKPNLGFDMVGSLIEIRRY